jgi:hypothetical protein
VDFKLDDIELVQTKFNMVNPAQVKFTGVDEDKFYTTASKSYFWAPGVNYVKAEDDIDKVE